MKTISYKCNADSGRLTLFSATILLLSACTGPAQTFGDFNSEPEIGAAVELPVDENAIDTTNNVNTDGNDATVDTGTDSGTKIDLESEGTDNQLMSFADLVIVGEINRVGFVELKGGEYIRLKAEFYQLASPISREKLAKLEDDLVLPAEKSCRFHVGGPLASRNNRDPADFSAALTYIATDNYVENQDYLTMVLAGQSISIHSSTQEDVVIEQTRLWNRYTDPEHDLSYSSSAQSVFDASADRTFTIAGSNEFPAFYGVPIPVISSISDFQLSTVVNEADPIAGSVLTWSAGAEPTDMAFAFSKKHVHSDSIVCSTTDIGTFVIPDVVNQVSPNWKSAAITLARHRLSAVQYDDTLLIVRNSAVSYLQ